MKHYKKIAKYIEEHESRCVVLLSLVVFVTVVFLNRTINGPTFASDEIGHLTNAIRIAGFENSTGSSWYAGYSLIIAPLFRVFSNPEFIWRSIVLINSALLSGAVIALYFLLKNLFTHEKKAKLLGVTLVCSLYPTITTMAGYSFSNPVFILTLILSLLFLVKSNLTNQKHLFVSSLLAVFLYTIHPTGVVYLVLLLILQVFLVYKFRNFKQIYSIAIIVAIPIIYTLLIHPTISTQSITSGAYGRSVPDFNNFINIDYLKRFAVLFMGGISYAIIASFGLVSYGASDEFSKALKKHTFDYKNSTTLAYILSLVSLTGVVALSAQGAAKFNYAIPAQYWVYGRYIDAYIIVLIGIGLLRLKYNKKDLYVSISILLFTGLALYVAYVSKAVGGYNYLLVNVQGFWPIYFFSSQPLHKLMIIGALATAVYFFILKKWHFLTFLIIPIFIISTISQINWHTDLYNEYGKQSGMVNFIRSNSNDIRCVSYSGINNQTKSLFQRERFKFMDYYLYNFNFKQQDFTTWKNECSGYYLTYNIPDGLEESEFNIIGKEINTGLFLIGKSNFTLENDITLNDKFVLDNYNKITVSADYLSNYTKIGNYSESLIKTTNSEGILLFGPSIALEKGSYNMKLHLNNYNDGDYVKILVTSDKGRVKHQEKVYVTVEKLTNDIKFRLDNQVFDFEVILLTNNESSFSFSSYSLERVE